MKHLKKIIIGTAAFATVAVGVSAYASRSDQDRQERMIERISHKLELDDSQTAALTALALEASETRNIMRGQEMDTRSEITALISADTFDQGKALSMITDRTTALQTRAPELVAAAALFFDGLSAEQKAEIQEFVSRKGHGKHSH